MQLCGIGSDFCAILRVKCLNMDALRDFRIDRKVLSRMVVPSQRWKSSWKHSRGPRLKWPCRLQTPCSLSNQRYSGLKVRGCILRCYTTYIKFDSILNSASYILSIQSFVVSLHTSKMNWKHKIKVNCFKIYYIYVYSKVMWKTIKNSRKVGHGIGPIWLYESMVNFFFFLEFKVDGNRG